MRLIQNRIVIKVGTSTLTNELEKSDLHTFDRLACILSNIHNMGYEVILVSSGTIAVGINKLNMKERPASMHMKQTAAIVGQCSIMYLYDKFFGDYDKTIAQMLLNAEDIEQEEKKENLTNTFNTVLCQSERLVILSDIDGLYDYDPLLHTGAKLIEHIEQINDSVYSLTGGVGLCRSTGDMRTKLQTASLATAQGIKTIITNGKNPQTLYDIVKSVKIGTLFVGRNVK